MKRELKEREKLNEAIKLVREASREIRKSIFWNQEDSPDGEWSSIYEDYLNEVHDLLDAIDKINLIDDFETWEDEYKKLPYLTNKK